MSNTPFTISEEEEEEEGGEDREDSRRREEEEEEEDEMGGVGIGKSLPDFLGLNEWKPCLEVHPPPPFDLESPVVEHIFSTWTNDKSKVNNSPPSSPSNPFHSSLLPPSLTRSLASFRLIS